MATRGDLPVALRVFCLPELAKPIYGWVNQEDRTSLLCVCRHLHFCIVPFVWEYIYDLHVLMKLIPGVKITDNSQAYLRDVRVVLFTL
ncbi:hypothetical protein BDV93DRAFT_240708 [Ceratobasidium sp. AG-I]|nr:hypothetical protein BDV93DRAFT_240708 [Ceratobasidium sp. AG-I]